MTFEEIKTGIAIGFGLSFMIGPVFFMLIQTSILKGFRAAISFDLGVILGDVTFILLAYYGSRPLLEKIKDDPRLFYLAGVILVIYGLITYLDKPKKKLDNTIIAIEEVHYTKLFIKGFLLNFINIGVLAFWLGMIVIIGPQFEMDGSRVFNYFTVILVSYFITDVFKILLAKQLKSKLTPKVSYQIKRAMGIILMISGVFIIAQTFLPKSNININNIIENTEEKVNE